MAFVFQCYSHLSSHCKSGKNIVPRNDAVDCDFLFHSLSGMWPSCVTTFQSCRWSSSERLLRKGKTRERKGIGERKEWRRWQDSFFPFNRILYLCDWVRSHLQTPQVEAPLAPHYNCLHAKSYLSLRTTHSPDLMAHGSYLNTSLSSKEKRRSAPSEQSFHSKINCLSLLFQEQGFHSCYSNFHHKKQQQNRIVCSNSSLKTILRSWSDTYCCWSEAADVLTTWSSFCDMNSLRRFRNFVTRFRSFHTSSRLGMKEDFRELRDLGFAPRYRNHHTRLTCELMPVWCLPHILKHRLFVWNNSQTTGYRQILQMGRV